MVLDKLNLVNFRNFSKLSFIMDPGLNILVGPNGQGKTNILEAIHLLSTTRSFRASRDSDLIKFGEEGGYVGGGGVEVVLRPGQKEIKLGGKTSRAAEVLGVIRSVMFSPEDMSLLSGPPQMRRAYLDELVSRIDRKYLLTLLSYHRSLKQRNRLLFMIREGQAKEGELDSWDEILISYGAGILWRRLQIINNLQELLTKLSPDLLGSGQVELTYLSKLTTNQVSQQALEEGLAIQLSETRPDQIRAATTITGPHRDDFMMRLDSRDVGRFGSRGQQRASILALKLAEVSLNETEAGSRPILLLDDVLSELDLDHQERLLAETTHQQTLITATHLGIFPDPITKKAQIFFVEAGHMRGSDGI
jgi:DNA replication and repair protein RecF